MSILNFAMYGTSLCRPSLIEEIENEIKKCNSLKALRNLAEISPQFEKILNDNVKKPIDALGERFEELEFDNKNIQTFPAILESDITNYFNEIMQIFGFTRDKLNASKEVK